jgi:hypothetical protein
MAHYFHYIKPETSPLKDVARVLDSVWEDELRDFESNPTPTHLFHHLVAAANWLNAGTDWTAEQYVAAWHTSPEERWHAARTSHATKEPTPANDAPANDGQLPSWEYCGIGSRYRLAGRRKSVTVIVGWDNPLSTFYAQVWDVPDGVTDIEAGRLLLWAGCSLNEIDRVEYLAELLRPYACVPGTLIERLERDRLGFNFEMKWHEAAVKEDQPVIYAYSRKQALADGVLVDVDKVAKVWMFKIPVAFTAAAWELAIVREGKEEMQSEPGRVWDVLHFLWVAILKNPDNSSELLFKATRPSDSEGEGFMTLKSVIGPDDDGKPCLTVMLPNED